VLGLLPSDYLSVYAADNGLTPSIFLSNSCFILLMNSFLSFVTSVGAWIFFYLESYIIAYNPAVNFFVIFTPVFLPRILARLTGILFSFLVETATVTSGFSTQNLRLSLSRICSCYSLAILGFFYGLNTI
jgi:hypothetical protein